ncbi:hypothetical protein [Streptomyces sp. NPDC093600]
MAYAATRSGGSGITRRTVASIVIALAAWCSCRCLASRMAVIVV